jgi:hypothetical protein
VVKEAEKKERSKGKQVVEQEDQGRQIIKEDGLCTTQQAEKDIKECFGAPCGKEERTGWQSPENEGHVGPRVSTPRVLESRFLTIRLWSGVVQESL